MARPKPNPLQRIGRAAAELEEVEGKAALRRRKRDKLVQAAVASGRYTKTEIARAAGVTEGYVRQLTKGE